VVTLAVYIYFIASLVGRQFIIDSSRTNSQDLYFPFFMFLEFIVYMGLLKVSGIIILVIYYNYCYIESVKRVH
ncbi:uncharacterized protein DC041_0000807, partial [Schistosoma bovis]